jgi:hypothetical protein
VSVHLSIPWDRIFELILDGIGLLAGWLVQIIWQAGSQLGTWGQVLLCLLLILVALWILRQLIRVAVFIALRIILPPGILTLAILFLLTLTS